MSYRSTITSAIISTYLKVVIFLNFQLLVQNVDNSKNMSNHRIDLNSFDETLKKKNGARDLTIFSNINKIFKQIRPL